jgi:hypothetical protein
LSVDATSYHPGDAITVTLSNQGPQTIYFQDHLTNCTVIQLQTQFNGNWQLINKCPLLSPTGWHSLDAGQSLTVKLVPSPDQQWPIGVLRATLSYGLARSIGALTDIYSAGFEVA